MEMIVDQAQRLDVFLTKCLPDHSRSKLSKLIDAGEVLVDGVVRKPGFPLKQGMSVALPEVPETPSHDLEPFDLELDVPYEDDSVLVVSKPRGLVTHPAPSLHEPTLVHALLARGHGLSAGSAEYRPGIVHRLDKETTGLLIVAKNDAAHRKLADQIARKTAERHYYAWVEGEFVGNEHRIEAPIGRDPRNRLKMAVIRNGKPAVTYIRGVWSNGERTLLSIRLETGRTHQIRVHLASAGHPVIGDTLYNRSLPREKLQLHAAFVSFSHPETGALIEVFSTPPSDFMKLELATIEGLNRRSRLEAEESVIEVEED